MEMPEEYVALRYDSYITKIDCSDLGENKDTVKQEIDDLKEKGTLGKLIIKEFPSGVPTVTNLKTFIEKMAYKNLKPDIIVVDYAALLRSSEKHEHTRIELQLIIRELRAMAKEMFCPIWTALQSNKDGTKSGVVDETNLAESYAQAAEADFIIGLFQKAGYGTLHVAKNRMGIKDRTYNIFLDTAKSTLAVLEENTTETNKDLAVKTAANGGSSNPNLKNFFKERQRKLKELDSEVKDVFNE
jgi:replicative DNA helicase